MRNVHQHAQRVRPRHYLRAEGRQAQVGQVAALGVGRRAPAQVVVADVHQPQVAGAACVGRVEPRQVMAQRISVLDADQGRQPALRMIASHLRWRTRQRDAIGVARYQQFDRLELVLAHAHRLGVAVGVERTLLHEDHEEGRVEAAPLHLAQVHLQHAVAARVEAGLAHVGIRDVDVAVDRQQPVRRRTGRGGRHRHHQ